MAVCRQGAATGGLYRKAVHASRFLSCLVRSVRMSTVFHTVTLLLEREPLSLRLSDYLHLFSLPSTC